jgi:hypothetical protein
MKTPNKTSYDVVLKSGEIVEACCGPAVVALGDSVRGYLPSKNKVQCQNRGNIDQCPVSVMRAEARKKTEERIAALRRKASLLSEEANKLERRIK